MPYYDGEYYDEAEADEFTQAIMFPRIVKKKRNKMDKFVYECEKCEAPCILTFYWLSTHTPATPSQCPLGYKADWKIIKEE